MEIVIYHIPNSGLDYASGARVTAFLSNDEAGGAVIKLKVADEPLQTVPLSDIFSMKSNRVFKKYFRRNAFVILILILLFAICGGHLWAADSSVPRKTIDFNSTWLFHGGDVLDAAQINANVSSWEKVNLPHTWNAADAFDDVSGYRMGVGWYRKELKLSELVSLGGDWRRKKIFLNFEAVGQKAEVFVNGQKAGGTKAATQRFTSKSRAFCIRTRPKRKLSPSKPITRPTRFSRRH